MFKTQVEPRTDREEFSLQSFQLLKHFFGPRTGRENTILKSRKGQANVVKFIIGRRKNRPKHRRLWFSSTLENKYM